MRTQRAFVNSEYLNAYLSVASTDPENMAGCISKTIKKEKIIAPIAPTIKTTITRIKKSITTIIISTLTLLIKIRINISKIRINIFRKINEYINKYKDSIFIYSLYPLLNINKYILFSRGLTYNPIYLNSNYFKLNKYGCYLVDKAKLLSLIINLVVKDRKGLINECTG